MFEITSDSVIVYDDNEFGITKNSLIQLMTYQGKNGLQRLEKLGGLDTVINKLHTSRVVGIMDSSDIPNRRMIFGSNVMKTKRPHSLWRLTWETVKTVSMVILFVVQVLSIGLNVWKKGEAAYMGCGAVAISLIVVVFVAVLHDYLKESEYCSQQNRMENVHVCNVIRGGEAMLIPVTDIVVGDICQIKYGDMVPVDGILVLSFELKIDYSPLTGVPKPVKKSVQSDPFVLAGMYVLEGRAKMLVTAVGVHTYIHTSNQLNRRKSLRINPTENWKVGKRKSENLVDRMRKSYLKTKLATFGNYSGIFGLCLVVITLFIEILLWCLKNLPMTEPFGTHQGIEIMTFALVAATCWIVVCPEILPLSITMCLSYSVKKMLKDKLIVCHLDACETMAYVTSICTNRTGCLTQDRMHVVTSIICIQEYDGDRFNVNEIPSHVTDMIVNCISINSSYTTRTRNEIEAPYNNFSEYGSRNDYALLKFLHKMGKDYMQIRSEHPEEIFRHVYTFNSYRKYMATVIPLPNGYRLFCKGAAWVLLPKCSFIYGEEGQLQFFTSQQIETMKLQVIEKMSVKCYCAIVLAYRDFLFDFFVNINETNVKKEPKWDNEDSIIQDLTCIGVIGIDDPVDPNVYAAVQKCHKAGIVVRLITGCNTYIAHEVAIKCGIIQSDDPGLVLSSKEFNKRIHDSDGQVQQHMLDDLWRDLRVLAKSTPEDKYNLINGAVESRLYKNVVVVSGYSVHDGPVLKKAHVGFALGRNGTDVAKEAADIIVADDKFSSIVKAVLWGRNSHDTISKLLQFQIVQTMVTNIHTFFSIIAFHKTIEMLFVSFVLNSLLLLTICIDHPSDKLLKYKPYIPTAPLISVTMLKNIIGLIIYQIIVILVIYFYDQDLFVNPTRMQHETLAFNSVVLMTLFNALNVRMVHGDRNIFHGLHRNLIFIFTWCATFIFQSFLMNGHFMDPSRTLPIRMYLWCVYVGVGTLVWFQLFSCVPDAALQRVYTWCHTIPKSYPMPLQCYWWKSEIMNNLLHYQRVRYSNLNNDRYLRSTTHKVI